MKHIIYTNKSVVNNNELMSKKHGAIMML